MTGGLKIAETKVSNQMTTFIPKPVRVALSLKPGDLLEWYVEGDEVKVRRHVMGVR